MLSDILLYDDHLLGWATTCDPSHLTGNRLSPAQTASQPGQSLPVPSGRNYQRQPDGAVFFVNPFNGTGEVVQSAFEQVWRHGTETQQQVIFKQNAELISPTMSVPLPMMTRNGSSAQVYAGQVHGMSMSRWPITEGQQVDECIPTAPLHVHPADLQSHTSTSLGQQQAQEVPCNATDQRDLQMSNSHDDHGFARSGMANPFSSNVRGRIISQSSSLCSTSPSDRSTVSNTPHTMSPHVTTFSTTRYGGDSSIDTSIDSISNSAASMSADLSRSSSTSDDWMSLASGISNSSKKSVKNKSKLRNIDRRMICEAALADPACRQEDLAIRFGIERSTVSKTLKNKDKWLNVRGEGGAAMIMKHRAGKFPELEEALVGWARDQLQNANILLDVTIRKRALEVAKECGLGADDFKASVGWIEKFRERNGFPKQYCTLPLADKAEGDEKIESTGIAVDVDHNKEQTQRPNRRSSNRLRGSSAMSPDAKREGESSLEQVVEEEENQVSQLGKSSPSESRPSSSSTLTEEASLNPATTTTTTTQHETPKASKRHYDQMVDQSDVSINLQLAQMQVKPESREKSLPVKETKVAEDTAPNDSEALPEQSKISKKAAPKRRKSVVRNNALPLMSAKVGKPRKSRSKAKQPTTAANGAAKGQDTIQLKPPLRHILPNEHSSAFVAPSLLMKRSVTNHEDLSNMTNALRPGLTRTVSFPTATQRLYGSTLEANGMLLPSHGQQAPASPFNPTSVQSIPRIDRPVTLEEARSSLNVVLTFIANQTGNLSSNEYLLLSNLQGTLDALARQNQSQPVTLLPTS